MTNSRGDVEYLYRGDGTVKAHYTYDTWGNVLSVTDENGIEITDANNIGLLNPIRYRGYYYDAETGYYYLQSRYYNPEMGRFINGDGYADTGMGLTSTNMFSYCCNNPVMMVDPDGTCPYNGTGIDFYRFEHGLPSIDCTCIKTKSTTKKEVASQVLPPLFETGFEIGIDIKEHAIKTAERPKNIGPGTYAQFKAEELLKTAKLRKMLNNVSDTITVAEVVIDVGAGVYDNVQAGASTNKIMWDAAVDVSFSATNVLVSSAFGSAIGSAICPAAGTTIGAVAGCLIGVVLDLSSQEPRRQIKDLY